MIRMTLWSYTTLTDSAGSNGDAGLTGDLFGASMRTVSMRVVIVPPRFEGLPTASSQTVP